MGRRLLTISLAVLLWVVGALMLVGAAGFAFAVMVHRTGSDGWTTSVVAAIGLAAGGAIIGWTGAWIMSSDRTAPDDDDQLDDASMWHV